MILTKNRLKKIRKRIEDDDDMLHYLKYSHLEPIREDDILGIDKATQFPDIMNNHTQTDTKDMKDKETDTYDELNTIDPPYYLTLASNNFKSKEPSRAEKMAQVWSTTVEKKTPPSSDSQDEDDGFMSRNVDRGLRMAQLTGSAMLTNLIHLMNMKKKKLKLKCLLVQQMPHSIWQEIEVEVVAMVMTPKVHQGKAVMSIIWDIDY